MIGVISVPILYMSMLRLKNITCSKQGSGEPGFGLSLLSLSDSYAQVWKMI